MMEEQKPKNRIGPPVWVESLMTEAEYVAMSKKYSTYCPDCNKVADFNKHTRWRYGMGSSPTAAEIKETNERIESLRQYVRQKQENEKQAQLLPQESQEEVK